ncbi:PH domain-containing protein [Jiangella alba]|uniref:Putative membrane protein n=1 Tax=Jiangella alba TaxID=561176 RepID=A0A1H5PQN9_9ACTN|nr:PH domain-containing protein [Jiangella alba]SEF15538.1 putative membrane protein [Jiangella alba]
MSTDSEPEPGPEPAPEPGPDPGPEPDAAADVPWQRLDTRVVWVDTAKTVLSMVPAGVAIAFFGAEINWGSMGPILVASALGVLGGLADLLRWVKTRYRITDDYVERRTGLLVRKHRSIRRDRIRSVDTSAKFRHRLTGLRVVTVGAGQHSATGESALTLDAVRAETAERLRQELLYGGPVEHTDTAGAEAEAEPAPTPRDEQVYARLQRSWVLYNVFSVWAFLMAGGLLWGTYWALRMFGVDLRGFVEGLVDWDAIGGGWTIAIGVATVGVIGVAGLAINFFTENWRFVLVRVPGDRGTVLRTSQGLFKTREVNRDDNRLRGVSIDEPLLWRWMGMADTAVISTGLTMMSMTPSAQILPRGPIGVARRVAGQVLRTDHSPLDRPLRPHPLRALRRRVGWALIATAGVTGLLAWLTTLIDAMPGRVWLAGLALLPITLALAAVAYRSLGHTVADGYLVTRSGAWSRSTAALQSRAIVGVTFRQSLLQRRLRLATVEVSTAAGFGAYQAIDVESADAVDLADRAVPGLLTEFRAPAPATAPADAAADTVAEPAGAQAQP